jgi:hypothetical protein
MELTMSDNYEIPKVIEISAHATDFFRIVGAKDWHPSFSSGPFLPITSNGEGKLPFNIIGTCGSTLIDYSQSLMLV